MNELTDSKTLSQPKKGKVVFWMFVPLLLLVTSVSGWLYMVAIAVNDPGFSVEPDYYKKASHYDDVIAQRAQNDRLGWKVELVDFAPQAAMSAQTASARPEAQARLVLRIVDATGAPLNNLQVTVDAFPTARGKQIQQLVLESLGTGQYQSALTGVRLGLWELRVRAVGGETFTAVLRPELKPLAGNVSKGVQPS